MTSGNSGASSDRDTVYFVSDAHFGLGDDSDRVKRFGELAAVMRQRATGLYILGDLFDFWIEYRRAIRPDYFLPLHILRGLIEAGVPVHYTVGNHDFAFGDFFEKALGISINPVLNAELQGRRVYMRHGDNVGKCALFKAVDRLLRNPFCQTLYKILHPDIGVKFGARCSAALKKGRHRRKMSARKTEQYRRAALTRLKTGTCDLVIFAHTHNSELTKFDEGEYCNIGSWIDNYDYAILRDGKIRLCKYSGSLIKQ